MKWIDSLEARFGNLAVPGLIRLVVMFNGLTYALMLSNPGYIQYLTLVPAKVAHGQVWRLFTYIFIPPAFSPLWLFMALMFLWYMGEALEQAWGAFKLNVFYLCGMAGCTIAAFFFGGIEMNAFLNLSLLFAFGTLFPDETMYVFFIIPVKIKWIALFSFVLVLATFLQSGLSVKMAILVSFSNYLIFFGPQLLQNIRHRQTVTARRVEFKRKAMPESEALHACAVCKETELTKPELDFRVSRDGNEYCTQHLPKPLPATPTQPAEGQIL